MMRDYTSEDKAMRRRLESQSFSGQRADVAGMLNKVAGLDAAQGLPGVASLLLLREARQGHERHIRRLNKQHASYFDRLHPSSPMRRAAAIGSDDARDESFTPQLKAERLAADGGMDADRQTRAGHWDGQGVHAAEPEWLTIKEMAALAAARAMATRYF